MIPLKDDNPRTAFPIVNITIIVINVLVFLRQLTLSAAEVDLFVRSYGAIPVLIVHGEQLQTLFTSMFLHGGFGHIIGNMLYLYIFGDNIENRMGSLRYVGFYLICGLGAAASHVLIEPGSQIPMVGASGAISGVLGAYMITFPRARVLVLVPIIWYITTFRVPAVFLLGFWFLMQLTGGLAALGVQSGGGIAWFAHIGGFVLGVVLIKAFEKKQPRYYEDDFDDLELY